MHLWTVSVGSSKLWGCSPAAAVDLLRSTEMRIRAVDSSNNMMPEKLTWNLMGARAPSAPHLL